MAAQSHVVYLDAPVRRVLSLVPPRYDDLWTGAKGFYKVEPIVADGGEVVLYAPHITRDRADAPRPRRPRLPLPRLLPRPVGPLPRPPRGELAHSTHLFGAGTYDPVDGERQRVQVTLATGIPEEVVHRANLSYLDPAIVDLDALAADPDTLVVPDAGEVLFRLSGPQG